MANKNFIYWNNSLQEFIEIPFEDVILDNLKRNVTDTDADGFVKTVEYRRNDDTLFMRRVYQDKDASTRRYNQCVEYFYDDIGVNIVKTNTYSFAYLDDGTLDTSTMTSV